MNQHNRFEEKYILLLCDIVCILIAYFVALYLRYGQISIYLTDTYLMLLLGILLFCLVYTLVISPGRHFVIRGYLIELQNVFKFCASTAIMVGMVIFLLRESENFSRLVFGYFLLLFFLLSYCLRCVLKRMLRRHFNSDRVLLKVMVITDQVHASKIITGLQEKQKYHYDVVGAVIWDRNEDTIDTLGVPLVAERNNLIEAAKSMAIDDVFIYLPDEKSSVMEAMIKDFEIMGVVCHQNIGMLEDGISISRVEKFGGYLVASYSVNELDYKKLAIKRLIDLIGGFIGIILLIILYPFIGLAIKLESKGPVMFSQVRIGKNGRRFRIYKFRSMYADAEERKKELEKQNEIKGLMFKMKNDPRVTKVGKFLRKTSLDEVPQFLNVLSGDMSLVGTRPPTTEEFKQYTPYYRRRLCMTPGLTGMWQVSGRSDITDFDEVVKMDLEYIDNWSLMLDFKIILQTIGVVLFRKGAK